MQPNLIKGNLSSDFKENLNFCAKVSSVTEVPGLLIEVFTVFEPKTIMLLFKQSCSFVENLTEKDFAG